MKCNNCGADAPADARFCPKCAAPLTAAAASAGNPSPPVAQRLATGPQRREAPPEDEVWSGTYSAKDMAEWFFGIVSLTITGIILIAIFGQIEWLYWFIPIALVLLGIVGLVALYRRKTVRYRLTTYRLYHEKGFLFRKHDRIEVIDIDDVSFTQGPIERILGWTFGFGTGTIRIICSDESLIREQHKSKNTENRVAEFEMPGIANVREIADKIDNVRRAERERRSLFMEPI